MSSSAAGCYPGRMRTPALVLLVLASAGFGLGLLADLVMLLFSPMMFDAPGATESIYPWLIVFSLMLNPIFVLIGMLAAWRAFNSSDYSVALRRLLIPLTGAGLVIGSFVALEVICDGEFACR